MAATPYCAMLLLLTSVVTSQTDNPGTTEHIEDIFMGRCYDYKQVKFKDAMPKVSTDCKELYNKFFEAFAMMGPCALNLKNYLPFMEAAKQQLPDHKAMFWSGLKQLVHEYALAGERYVTLEDTLIGYVVDGLVWCGQEIQPGMNFTRCPSWSDCPSEASEAFWGMASKTFAESASGHVTVMLNASSNRPAYRPDSFFGKYELPYLDTSRVTGLSVLLVHPLDTPAVETCNTGSLVQMRQDVTSRGFPFSCQEDPEAILHLLCVDNPSDRACQLASSYMFPWRQHTPQRPLSQPLVVNTKPDRFASPLSSHVSQADST